MDMLMMMMMASRLHTVDVTTKHQRVPRWAAQCHDSDSLSGSVYY